MPNEPDMEEEAFSRQVISDAIGSTVLTDSTAFLRQTRRTSVIAEDALDGIANRRNLIMNAINKCPGIHLRELIRRTGLKEGDLRHHLRVLIRSSQLVKVHIRHRTCYFDRSQRQRPTADVPPLDNQIWQTVRQFQGISCALLLD